MSWFIAWGWQFWLFTIGIAFLIAGLVVISIIIQGHSKNKQYQCLKILSPKSKNRYSICNQINCAQSENSQCGSEPNEVGQEPQTTKTKQEKNHGQKDYQDKEPKLR